MVRLFEDHSSFDIANPASAAEQPLTKVVTGMVAAGSAAPVASWTVGLQGVETPVLPVPDQRMLSAVEAIVAVSANRMRWGVLACGAVLALTGCESATEGSAGPATPSTAAEVPAGFDPCTDIPQEVLESEDLADYSRPTSSDTSGGRWKGCNFVQPDGYAVGIQTTTITVDMVRDKGFPGTTEFTIGGRKAITSQRQETNTEAACSVNVEMNGGSLEFGLSNPASNRKTGHLDSCELARTLAEKVAPAIPPGA